VEVARAGVVDGPEIEESQLVLIYVFDACNAVCMLCGIISIVTRASAQYSQLSWFRRVACLREIIMRVITLCIDNLSVAHCSSTSSVGSSAAPFLEEENMSNAPISL
jgi:hypothetical protein